MGTWGFSTWLLVGLLFVAGAIGLTGGGISTQPAGRLEIATALLAAIAALGISGGRMPMSIKAPGAAWIGVCLLFGFALWSLLSIHWSVFPEGSWLAGNRAFGYAMVAGLTLVAAGATARAAEKTAIGLAVIGVVVALYAISGKLFPGIHIGPVDLDPGGRFPRITGSLDYWNALGLICVMASPAAIWIAAKREAPARMRVGAAVLLGILVLTVALAYSRGAILGYITVLAVMVGAGPRRLTRLGVGVGAVFAVLPAMVLAFTRHDLSAADVPLHDRVVGGALLAVVLLACLIALALAVRWAIRLEPRLSWSAAQSRRTWRILGGGAVALVAIAILVVSFTGRGLTGEISHQIDSFKEPDTGLTNTPDRLISSNSSSRYEWWSEAVGAFSDKPLDGLGAGSFPIVHYLYRDELAPVRSSHSLPLMFLSETGLVGFLLGMGALAALAAAAVQNTRRTKGEERTARLVLLAAFAAWFVQSLFDWHWEIPGVTIPALIAVCAAAAPPVTEARDRTGAAVVPLQRRGALVFVTMVGILAFAVSAWLPALSEQKRLHALAIAASDPAGAADSVRLARKLDPLSVDALFTQSSIAAGRDDEQGALEPLITATLIEPDSQAVWRQYFNGLVRYGYIDAGVAALPHLRETDPVTYKNPVSALRGLVFAASVPPAQSPTAFGTPPP